MGEDVGVLPSARPSVAANVNVAYVELHPGMLNGCEKSWEAGAVVGATNRTTSVPSVTTWFTVMGLLLTVMVPGGLAPPVTGWDKRMMRVAGLLSLS